MHDSSRKIVWTSKHIISLKPLSSTIGYFWAPLKAADYMLKLFQMLPFTFIGFFHLERNLFSTVNRQQSFVLFQRQLNFPPKHCKHLPWRKIIQAITFFESPLAGVTCIRKQLFVFLQKWEGLIENESVVHFSYWSSTLFIIVYYVKVKISSLNFLVGTRISRNTYIMWTSVKNVVARWRNISSALKFGHRTMTQFCSVSCLWKKI